MDLHISYCNTFGISRSEVDATTESQACTAYTRFVLDTGATHDFFALQVAMAPCSIGYRDIAMRIARENKDGRGNIYWKWVESYCDVDYGNSYKEARELLEKYAVRQSAGRIDELVEIFAKATKVGFLWFLGIGDWLTGVA